MVAGDVSYDLDYVDAHSLERGADESGTLGTILMMSTNPTIVADLDLALVGASGSISASQAIVVDGTTPYVRRAAKRAAKRAANELRHRHHHHHHDQPHAI